MERRKYYAINTMFPFVAAFIERSLVFVESCEVTRINILNTQTVNKVLCNQRRRAWGEDEVVRLRWEISKFKSVV